MEKIETNYPNDKSSIGERIKAARKNLGLSQIQFAAELGVSPNYLGIIERDLKKPSMQLLNLIARKTNLSYEYLSGGESLNQAKTKASTNFGFPKAGYMGKLLKAACNEVAIVSESASPNLRNTTVDDYPFFVPDYWLYVHESSIRYWAFDLGQIIYKRNKPLLSDHLRRFYTNALYFKPEFRKVAKYSFVVDDPEAFMHCQEISICIGNLSAILINPNDWSIAREHELCPLDDDSVAKDLEKLHIGKDFFPYGSFKDVNDFPL